MKVKCKNCGKKFDYDVYTGLCPKCHTYYRVDAVSPEKSTKNQERRREKRKHGPLYRLITICLLLIILISATTIIGFTMYTNQKGKELLRLEKLMTPKALNIGEIFSYETENHHYEIMVTKVQREDGAFLETPGGYESIKVSYEIKESSKDSDENQEETPSYETNIVSDYFKIEPYLMTKTGSYVKSLGSYAIRENLGYDYEQMEEEGIGSDFFYREGCFYFTVKEGDAQSLLIQAYKYEEEYSADNILEQTYEIDSLEVES
ncbi:MAG: hypothetical protein Q4B70_07735 [Lachnospiraceae bacterium]|nr:hypothetical protein [Lachnospiraceae bacterium]